MKTNRKQSGTIPGFDLEKNTAFCKELFASPKIRNSSWTTVWCSVRWALIAFTIVFGISIGARRLYAHPISMSVAAVEVRENEIIVEMEIMLEDLVLYHSLSANGEMMYSQKDLLAAAEKHRKFLLEYFTLLDRDGNRLTGTIEKETLDQIVEAGVHQSELMKKVAIYRIRYPHESEKPKFLTFLQNFGGKSSALPAVMEVSVVHRNRLENSFQLPVGRPQTIAFDWDRVYQDTRPSFAELKQKRKDQLQASLGISSYTGLYSFLYVTRFELRHEVLIPLITLEQWIPIERKDPDFLEVDEQAKAKQSIEEFFTKHNVATINGNVVQGKLTRFNFFSLDIADFALNAEPRRVNVNQARVGVIWTFPSNETPKTAKLEWTAYSEYAPFLSSVVLIGNEAPKRYFFHSMQLSYDWTGDIIGPKVEPVSVETFPTIEANRKPAFEAMLRNIYRAFDFREDGDVYDALATSVKGDLLREVYLRIKRSLIMAEQGGALSHANQIDVLHAEALKNTKGKDWEVQWQVTSVSEHWGHIHKQTTEYKAKIAIGRDANTWKMEAFQLLDEKKIKFETSIRGNDPAS